MISRRIHQPIGRLLVAGLAVLVAVAAAFGDEGSEALYVRIDAALARHWESRRIVPAEPASDAEFLRRVSLDLNGAIPTAEQVRVFLDDARPDKRSHLIDELLARPEYALHMGRVFDVVLAERRSSAVRSYDVARSSWRSYLTESFARNKPWHQLVREILASDGSDESTAGAVKFYVTRDADPHQLTRDVGRIFLGVDWQCAQCHDDPRFDDYKQADYYGLYAFLNRLTFFRDNKANRSLIGEKAAGDVSFTSVFTAKQGKTDPRLPDAAMLPDPPLEKGMEFVVPPGATERGVPKYSRRMQLAERLPRAETRGFARNLANRLWAQLLGRGLVHPVDLTHAANPPSQPEVLTLLEQWLVAHDFDIRGCLREIALTRAYQLSSELPPGAEPPPEADFAVAKLRGLTPEQLRWSLLQATGRLSSHLTAAESKLRQMQPEEFETRRSDWRWRLAQYEQLERASEPVVAKFAGLEGQGDGEFQPTVDHALFLQNGATLLELLKVSPGSTLERGIRGSSASVLAEEVYLSVLSRRPTTDESADFERSWNEASDEPRRRSAAQSLFWGLLLSAEFRVNH